MTRSEWCGHYLRTRPVAGAYLLGMSTGTVRQLRLVVVADDYEAALTFYRDVLGMPEQESYRADGGAVVTILDAGRATLELVNPAQVAYIDKVEVGHPASRAIRVALEVGDVRTLTRAAIGGGAELVAPPTRTPWDSLNARLEGPAGLQLTLFEELDEQQRPVD